MTGVSSTRRGGIVSGRAARAGVMTTTSPRDWKMPLQLFYSLYKKVNAKTLFDYLRAAFIANRRVLET